MIKDFKKYDSYAVKSTIVPIHKINEIFENYGSDLRFITKEEEHSRFGSMNVTAKMCSESNQNKPHTAIASDVLGIHITDWQWANNGEDVEIFYENK